MYSIINRCYGVILRDYDEGEAFPSNEVIRNLLCDLADFEGVEPSDSFFTDTELEEIMDEVLPDSKYVFRPYSGDGQSPCVLGVRLDSWPAWMLEGPNGIIASVSKGVSDKDISDYNNKVPKDVRKIMEKHGLSPRICYVMSTS